MISNMCQVVACRSKVSRNIMSILSTVDITIKETIPIQEIGTNTRNGTNTEDQYEYRKNDTV